MISTQIIGLSIFFIVFAPILVAQTDYLKQTVGVGVGAPLGRFGETFEIFKNAPGVQVEYGYRLHRNLQADVGFESVINGWNTSNVCQSPDSPATNAEYMIPFGGRGILPLNGGKVLLSLGGGGAYLKYTSPCIYDNGNRFVLSQNGLWRSAAVEAEARSPATWPDRR